MFANDCFTPSALTDRPHLISDYGDTSADPIHTTESSKGENLTISSVNYRSKIK